MRDEYSVEQMTKPPVWYWIVAGLGLAWNLIGIVQFFIQITMSAESIAKLPENERAIYENIPIIATAGFAIAVFGGTAGCVLLLLRRKWAYTLFITSLIGILIQFTYSLLMTKAIQVYGAGIFVMPGLVVLIASGLLWLSHSAKSKGWLQ